MQNFWQGWLLLLADGMIVVGLVMIVWPLSPVFAPLHEAVFQALFASHAPAAAAQDLYAMLFAMIGATTAGWGVLVFFVVWKPFARREAWAWVALAVSTTSWFALDTTIVLLAGALPFAVFNIVVMLAADVALIATYRQFFPARGVAPA